MAASNFAAASVDSGLMLPAFAKLEGVDFVYFMRKYSIILGRNTETSEVDLDLSEVGGGRGPRVSRHHARIFYDFEHRHFALEVLGKNGCIIQEVSYLPGCDPVKLNSQDRIEFAGKQIYFLLPCVIFATHAARDYPGHSYDDDYGRSNGGNGHSNGENGRRDGENGRSRSFTGELETSNSNGINADPTGTDGEYDNNTEDQVVLEEERNFVSSLVVMIPDLCSPGEWVSMERLYSEILERYGNNWTSARITRYLPQNDSPGSSTETEGRPWCCLLPLLRKYPEHFVMSTVTRGEVESYYVGLVSSENGP